MENIKQFLKSKGLTQSSIKTYSSILNKVFMHIGRNFEESEVEELFTKLNLKSRTYNLYRNVVNFYTTKYLNYQITFDKAKVSNALPTWVREHEFDKLLQHIPNIKHKFWYILMYYSGMREFEVAKLKRENIYFDRCQIFIKEGKGKKDRPTIFPQQLIHVLKNYSDEVERENASNPYLFQTYRGHISTRSLQERLNTARQDSKINKQFTCHDLRHSFGINLAEKKVTIERIRRLMGHASLRTTQIYLQCLEDDLESISRLECNITQFGIE